MAEWVQLEAGDDWGHAYVAYRALDGDGRASRRRAILAEYGDRVLVRWPDGTETEESIAMERVDRTVGDMGRTETVRSDVPVLVVHVRGALAIVALTTPGVLVRSDAFRTREEGS